MKKLITSALAVALSSVASLSPAADNRQNFQGSVCDNFYASDSGSFDHQHNGLRNTSGTGKMVHCPLTIDESVNTGGTNWVWVRWSGTGTMSCTMLSHDVNNNVASSAAGYGGPGWFSIPAVSDADTWGNYSLYCSLPGLATLQTIVMSESD